MFFRKLLASDARFVGQRFSPSDIPPHFLRGSSCSRRLDKEAFCHGGASEAEEEEEEEEEEEATTIPNGAD